MTGSDGAELLEFDEARRRILERIEPVTDRQTLALSEALGRVLAESVAARVDVPGHDNSAMDGFALRAADTGRAPARLALVGDSFAGHPFTGMVGPGECVRIMTGGVLPAGADSVVMQEKCSRDGETIRVSEPVEAGHHVRRADEDFARGATVLPADHYLRPADLGVLASVGVAQVDVYRRPRVGFFSTGDELRGLGETLEPGQIYDSNRYALQALVQSLGLTFVDYGVVRDEPAALRDAFDQASRECDALITSGGVSVGAADYVVDILRELGEIGFWKVAVKPGKPFAFGRMNGAAFFGLPGNPVSAVVGFMQYVRPALVRMSGAQPADALRFTARLSGPLRKSPGRLEFQRGRLDMAADGQPTVTPFGHQGSGVLRSMSQADCFLVLEPDSGDRAASDAVTVEPFSQPVWGFVS
ncbi:MAG: molybdopterin molybdenumtransferase MoeA [Salinisphaeraceae bacterium]|jgi:molybdopterin molybdotransferase|nr:molybdopterin molybdenumtransferase MoeA [Salinisphaeraceae bacterium]